MAASRPLASAVRCEWSIEDVRGRYLGELTRRLREDLSATGLIRKMADYHLATSGKRMRALLPVWVCVNLGGRAEAAIDLGVGLELLHNATLIHDDVQDGDAYRRGQPTVWRRWGVAHAISTGDALLFEAMGRIARSAEAPRLMTKLAATIVRLAEGQAMELQMQLAEDHPHALPQRISVWEEVARRKTGALLAACMRAGAVAAEQCDEVVEAAAAYGEELGVLFQMQDDYLDLVGDKGRRRRGSDLFEGKLSFPVLWAYEHGSPADTAPLRRLLERPREALGEAFVAEALAVLGRSGALEATAGSLQTMGARARAHPLASVVPGWVDHCLALVGLARPGPIAA